LSDKNQLRGADLLSSVNLVRQKAFLCSAKLPDDGAGLPAPSASLPFQCLGWTTDSRVSCRPAIHS
jgi:hypothetical protein